LTGRLADTTGSLQFALIIPALCYVVIGVFGLFSRHKGKWAQE
jgi:FHS family L-fucose permease-like MFS transporter